jgi:tetratricopeptide (TPR) repeat protein
LLNVNEAGSMTRWVVLVLILARIVSPSFAADPLSEAESLLTAQRTRPDAAQFARAKEIAAVEVRRSPREPRAWILLAWAQMTEHRFLEALDAARTAERLAPGDARVLALAADALDELDYVLEAARQQRFGEVFTNYFQIEALTNRVNGLAALLMPHVGNTNEYAGQVTRIRNLITAQHANFTKRLDWG